MPHDLTPGFHADLPADQYFSLPRLSASGAKLILKSPAHYLTDRTSPRTETPALRMGSAFKAIDLAEQATSPSAYVAALNFLTRLHGLDKAPAGTTGTGPVQVRVHFSDGSEHEPA